MLNEVIEQALFKNGALKQQIVCMEECSELAKAISKLIRSTNKQDKLIDNLTEEIADVLICIEMLKKIHNIPTVEIETVIASKIERLKQRGCVF